MGSSQDLYKTKLCILFQRGHCQRQSCSFAHGEAELRRFSNPMAAAGGGGSSGSGSRSPFNNGRIESGYHNGDLRDRLERQRSLPIRRHSPFRGRPAHYNDHMLSPQQDRGGRSRTRTPPIRPRLSRSPSPQRSPPVVIRRESKRLRTVVLEQPHFSDVSGEARGTEDGNGVDDFMQLAQERMPSTTPPPSSNPHDTHDTQDTLEDQLRQVQAQNNELADEKSKLQYSLEKKIRETSNLSTQNQELESRLAGANEDYRRLGSKLKLFVKIYARYLHAQDVVQKTQSKLKQLAEELALEWGEELDAPMKESDGLSEADLEQPSSHSGAKLENPTTRHEATVVTNHNMPSAALAHDEDHGKAPPPPVPRRIVASRIGGVFRESEGYSDTHGEETGHSDPKLLSPASMHMAQQRVSNHSVMAHKENGFIKSHEMDQEEEEDWASGSRPSFHLTLAGTTDKSEKQVEPREDFFVPLDVKEADIITKSSKSPPVDKLRMREEEDHHLSAPASIIMASQAQDFELHRKDPHLQGLVESHLQDGGSDGVNVSLSLASQAYC